MAFGRPEQPEADPETELADLKRKLDKRENEPGFADNAEAIKARIAELSNED